MYWLIEEGDQLEVLLNSGYKNPQLGKNLKTHPVSGVAAKFNEKLKYALKMINGAEAFLYEVDFKIK